MKNKSVLVVAAHPDDEILGCGGTMAKHVDLGDQVVSLIVAEGLTSRDNARDALKHSEGLSDLRKTAIEANEKVGVKDVRFLGFPDNRMDSMDLLDVVKGIESVIQDVKPDIVYTHHYGDLNVDHRIVNQAVLTALRPQGGGFPSQILFFEVSSATAWYPSGGEFNSFTPNFFSDVDKYLNAKLNALVVYKSEMREYPHARSNLALENLARYRGNQVGLNAAEAFVVGRIIS